MCEHQLLPNIVWLTLLAIECTRYAFVPALSTPVLVSFLRMDVSLCTRTSSHHSVCRALLHRVCFVVWLSSLLESLSLPCYDNIYASSMCFDRVGSTVKNGRVFAHFPQVYALDDGRLLLHGCHSLSKFMSVSPHSKMQMLPSSSNTILVRWICVNYGTLSLIEMSSVLDWQSRHRLSD
jgi:hypothetical protein